MRGGYGILTTQVLALILSAASTVAGDLTFKYPEVKPGESKGKKICIRNLTDLREFQDKPATADISSLAAGNASTDEATKHRAVARVRDGMGKARTNVFLGENESVMTVMRKVIGDGLIAAGYEVVEPAQAGRDAATVDVDIKKFWGWINVNPGGAWAGSGKMMMTVDIDTDLKLDQGWFKGKKTIPVSTRVELKLGIGVSGRAWQNTFLKAFQDYHAKFAAIEL